MNQYEFVLGIVIVVMVTSLVKYSLRLKGRTSPTEAGAGEAERLRDEVRTLKERIAVLERIATDKSTMLEREIEELRDR